MQHLINKVHNLDALDFLALIEPQSVDAIITDLPYGTTACKWDTIIPFEPMWAAVKRVLKPRGVFVTTASQPFTSALVMSNPAWFKVEWVWEKQKPTGFLYVKQKPLKAHEAVVVFARGEMNYFAQGIKSIKPVNSGRKNKKGLLHSGGKPNPIYIQTVGNYPRSILRFDTETGLHPSQKPIPLYEYLISTYTLPGELVVDPCCGSGTTGVAARNLKRDYILNDKELEYVEITRDRLRGAWDKPRQKESDLSGLPLFDGTIDEENHS